MLKKLVKFKDLGGSFFINFFSLFLFWATDAIIVTKYEAEFVSNWALIKSVIFITGSFITLGVDQAIVRLKLDYKESLWPILIQVLVLSILSCLVIYIFNFSVSYGYLLLCLIFYSLILILYSYQRSRMNYTLSLIILNCWRMIFFILVFTGLFERIDISLTIALTSVVLFLFLAFYKNKVDFRISEQYRKALGTGFYFFLSILSLNVILFLDQILINKLGDELTSEILFSHVTFFIAPFAAGLSFIGFLLTPYIRDNREKAFFWLRKYILLFILVGIIFSASAFFVANILYTYLKNDEPIFWLGITLSLILFTRFLLMIPSSFFGAFANNQLLKKISFQYNLVNLVYLVGTCFMFYILDFTILKSLLLSLLATWLLRALIGFNGLFKIESIK